MKNHVMIDLETIGNDHDGLFTTIGACKFYPETGAIRTPTFYRHVNWESAITAGRTVTPSTIKWWMTQSEEARAEIVEKGAPIEDVLSEFSAWLHYTDEDNPPIVWGNGPIFDIVKLESAYGYYNIPWKFFNVRCVRTIRDLAKGLVDRDDIPFEGEKHNALDDAIHQAKYVSAMWQALRDVICEHEVTEIHEDKNLRAEVLICKDCHMRKVRNQEDLTPWESLK